MEYSSLPDNEVKRIIKSKYLRTIAKIDKVLSK